MRNTIVTIIKVCSEEEEHELVAALERTGWTFQTATATKTMLSKGFFKRHILIISALDVDYHTAIKKLQAFLVDNPSADWAKAWISCLAYRCSCGKCLELLRKNDTDIQMLNNVFNP